MQTSKTVCVITFRQGDPDNPIEKTRSEVFLDTVKTLKKANLNVFALHTDTQENTLEKLKQLDVILEEQKSSGMGSIRREALEKANKHFEEPEYLCWLEPEKPDIVQFIKPLVDKMSIEKTALGLFNRVSMESYPSEQAHYYLFCRSAASCLVGFDIDYAFGPMIISQQIIPHFLEYQSEYGDKWDSILVPRLTAINRRLGLSILPIEFKNDPRMTRIETCNAEIIMKRVEQFNNVIPSLIKGWLSPSI